ncbi:37S ribosomal protein, mitochondrial [Tulasnella sp. 419]|nr:37S ribosomal protein, mitochondrial [Tulasnella sp. 419]
MQAIRTRSLGFVGRRGITTASEGVLKPRARTPPPPNEWEELMHSRSKQHEIVSYFSQLGSTQTRDNSFQPHHPLHRPPGPHEATISALMAAGAHLGHSHKLLRPAFMPYAYGTRSGVTIINLEETVPLLRRAANVLRAVARNGGSVVFLGTHESLRPAVIKAAQRIGHNAFHVASRWKPGTLTNSEQIFGSQITPGLQIVPDLVVLLNPADNLVAIRECAVKHVPTIGIIDSNIDPRLVTYPIPANDDSVRTAELISGLLSLAGKEGATAYLEQKEQSQQQRAA